MSDEYSLKKSKDKSGPLYPVIIAKNGRVIDGRHRLKEDPDWPMEIT